MFTRAGQFLTKSALLKAELHLRQAVPLFQGRRLPQEVLRLSRRRVWQGVPLSRAVRQRKGLQRSSKAKMMMIESHRANSFFDSRDR
jgi:hypothetical protein